MIFLDALILSLTFTEPGRPQQGYIQYSEGCPWIAFSRNRRSMGSVTSTACFKSSPAGTRFGPPVTDLCGASHVPPDVRGLELYWTYQQVPRPFGPKTRSPQSYSHTLTSPQHPCRNTGKHPCSSQGRPRARGSVLFPWSQSHLGNSLYNKTQGNKEMDRHQQILWIMSFSWQVLTITPG